MAEVIVFESPIQSDPGVMEMRLRTLTIDLEEPLVKIVLQASDASGNFIVTGKTENIRYQGVAAAAILNTPTYVSVLSSVIAQLVAGTSLPVPGTVVVR